MSLECEPSLFLPFAGYSYMRMVTRLSPTLLCRKQWGDGWGLEMRLHASKMHNLYNYMPAWHTEGSCGISDVETIVGVVALHTLFIL